MNATILCAACRMHVKTAEKAKYAPGKKMIDKCAADVLYLTYTGCEGA